MIRAAPPAVTVGIPAYDNAATIGQAVRSVLEQTFPDFELLVIDDASTDGTLERLAGLPDPRLRTLRNPSNLGPEANWNRILEESRGRYIKLLPGDDFLFPRCLEAQYEALERPENRGAALACCARRVVDERGRAIMTRAYGGPSRTVPGPLAIRANARAGTNLIGEPAAVLFRAGLVPAAGRFDNARPYVIDLDYWLRLLLLGDLAVLEEPLCAFRVSRAAASTRTASTQSRDFRAFLRKIAADPRFGLRPADVRRGARKAVLYAWARRLLYARLFRGRAKPDGEARP